MEEHNKYGMMSGGVIFDHMDRDAHKRAVNLIGECVTASAEIKFFEEQEYVFPVFNVEIVSGTKNTITIRLEQPGVVTATFTFIKRKTND